MAVPQLLLETAAWLAIAAGAWILSMEFAGRDMLFRWGAEFWPRAVAGLIAVLALINLVVRFRELAGATVAEPDRAPATHWPGPAQAATLGATLVLPLLFAFLLPRTGYYVVTPFFISAMMFLFGMRRPLHLVGTALLIYAAFLLVFSKLLYIPLPTGYWPGFYEANITFIELLGI